MSVDEALLSGNRLSLSRFLTQVENGDPSARVVLDALYAHTGKAHRIGVTGAPGTGKSSLVNRLTQYIRSSLGRTVAIVAVDPSSPFSGGAILGDRVRMRDLAGDPGVFIRSMASRGALGGLALTTAQLVQVFDAAGFDFIIIETVGAGQAEIEIAHLAHTTIVVEAPGFGDDIQAIKAGIMEIADILVINKADLPGVENTERALRSNLEMGYHGLANRKAGHTEQEMTVETVKEGWVPPILRTIATEEDGVAELCKAVQAHYAYLVQSGQLEQLERDRLQKELGDLLQDRLLRDWREKAGTLKMETALNEVASRKWSPYQAVDWLIEH
jgi:LAO/AO transport system kinase